MFIIELTYLAELADIDAHMKAHVAFLDKHYASGHFLVSGRKIPRDGGIIVALGESREQLPEWMQSRGSHSTTTSSVAYSLTSGFPTVATEPA